MIAPFNTRVSSLANVRFTPVPETLLKTKAFSASFPLDLRQDLQLGQKGQCIETCMGERRDQAGVAVDSDLPPTSDPGAADRGQRRVWWIRTSGRG
jgi:hypothetical protein